jgi:hypothetical protein
VRWQAPAALVAAAAVLLPAVAWACPACATNRGPGTIETLALVAAMIALPYAVVTVLAKVIRNLDQDRDKDTT